MNLLKIRVISFRESVYVKCLQYAVNKFGIRILVIARKWRSKDRRLTLVAHTLVQVSLSENSGNAAIFLLLFE